MLVLNTTQTDINSIPASSWWNSGPVGTLASLRDRMLSQRQQNYGGDSGLQEAAGWRTRRHRWDGGGKSQQHRGTSHQHHHNNGSSSSTDWGEAPDWRKLHRGTDRSAPAGCITAWCSSFPEPHQNGAGESLRPTLQEESQLDYETPTTPVTACFPSPQLLDGTEAREPNWGPVLFHRPYDCWTLTPTVWQPESHHDLQISCLLFNFFLLLLLLYWGRSLGPKEFTAAAECQI